MMCYTLSIIAGIYKLISKTVPIINFYDQYTHIH